MYETSVNMPFFLRLFGMIFVYCVIYFAALHIEPRVAQQCFWSKLANDVRKVAGNKKFLLGRRRKAGEPEKCIKCIKKSCDDKGLYKSKRIRLCCTTSIYFLYVFSCDVLGVLEKEKCQPSSSLGLHGLSRGRRKAKAGLCCQGTLPGKKSHHWSQGT